jgi:hypothetical protein
MIRKFIVKNESKLHVEKKKSTMNLKLLDKPKNETEALLHRKLRELNDTKMDMNKLELKLQKERNTRIKLEEKI